MKSGAIDFLTKPVLDDDLITAVRRALDLDRTAREEEARLASVGERLASLTPREHEVLASVIAGRLNKQIAAELRIAEKTVKVHRARVMAKMAVRSVAELCAQCSARWRPSRTRFRPPAIGPIRPMANFSSAT